MILGGFPEGDVSGVFHEFLAFGRKDVVHKLLHIPAAGIVRTGFPARDHRHRFAPRIGAAADVLVGRRDAVDGKQFDFLVAEQFRRIKAVGIADGAFAVPVGGGFVAEPGESFPIRRLGRFHERGAAHQLIKRPRNKVLAPLVGDDHPAFGRADILPVRDRPGINAPDLLRRQVVDRIVRVDVEDEGVHAERSSFVLDTIPFRRCETNTRRGHRHEAQLSYVVRQELINVENVCRRIDRPVRSIFLPVFEVDRGHPPCHGGINGVKFGEADQIRVSSGGIHGIFRRDSHLGT